MGKSKSSWDLLLISGIALCILSTIGVLYFWSQPEQNQKIGSIQGQSPQQTTGPKEEVQHSGESTEHELSEKANTRTLALKKFPVQFIRKDVDRVVKEAARKQEWTQSLQWKSRNEREWAEVKLLWQPEPLPSPIVVASDLDQAPGVDLPLKGDAHLPEGASIDLPSNTVAKQPANGTEVLAQTDTPKAPSPATGSESDAPAQAPPPPAASVAEVAPIPVAFENFFAERGDPQGNEVFMHLDSEVDFKAVELRHVLKLGDVTAHFGYTQVQLGKPWKLKAKNDWEVKEVEFRQVETKTEKGPGDASVTYRRETEEGNSVPFTPDKWSLDINATTPERNLLCRLEFRRGDSPLRRFMPVIPHPNNRPHKYKAGSGDVLKWVDDEASGLRIEKRVQEEMKSLVGPELDSKMAKARDELSHNLISTPPENRIRYEWDDHNPTRVHVAPRKSGHFKEIEYYPLEIERAKDLARIFFRPRQIKYRFRLVGSITQEPIHDYTLKLLHDYDELYKNDKKWILPYWHVRLDLPSPSQVPNMNLDEPLFEISSKGYETKSVMLGDLGRMDTSEPAVIELEPVASNIVILLPDAKSFRHAFEIDALGARISTEPGQESHDPMALLLNYVRVLTSTLKREVDPSVDVGEIYGVELRKLTELDHELNLNFRGPNPWIALLCGGPSPNPLSWSPYDDSSGEFSHRFGPNTTVIALVAGDTPGTPVFSKEEKTIKHLHVVLFSYEEALSHDYDRGFCERNSDTQTYVTNPTSMEMVRNKAEETARTVIGTYLLTQTEQDLAGRSQGQKPKEGQGQKPKEGQGQKPKEGQGQKPDKGEGDNSQKPKSERGEIG